MNTKQSKTKEFQKDNAVRYKPTGEIGLVSSTNDIFVFVKFRSQLEHNQNGQACRPEDLEKI